MDVFKNDLEIISDRDKNKQSFEIINLKKKLKEKYNGLWTDIKQKQNKNNLIMDFVINKKKEFNLNNIELKQLLTTIQIGFIFKKINSDDIDYSNGIIYGINGLEFTQNNVNKFTFDLYSLPTHYKSNSSKIDVDKKIQLLERYIKEYIIQVNKIK